MAIKMKKTKVTMDKSVYLGLSVLDIIKIAIYEYWYGYAKPKYEHNAKLSYMYTDRFVI